MNGAVNVILPNKSNMLDSWYINTGSLKDDNIQR